jgi:hypothetical protein
LQDWHFHLQGWDFHCEGLYFQCEDSFWQAQIGFTIWDLFDNHTVYDEVRGLSRKSVPHAVAAGGGFNRDFSNGIAPAATACGTDKTLLLQSHSFVNRIKQAVLTWERFIFAVPCRILFDEQ